MIKLQPHEINQDSGRFMAAVILDGNDVDSSRFIFNINTYAMLRSNLDSWKVIDVVNDFVSTLIKDDRDKLSHLFISSKQMLDRIYDNPSLTEAMTNIDRRVFEVFEDTSLVMKISDFVNKHHQINPIRSDDAKHKFVGESEFTKDDLTSLLVLSIVIKLLFPIFGETISKMSNFNEHSQFSKESAALKLVDTLMMRSFNDISTKFVDHLDLLADIYLSAYLKRPMTTEYRDRFVFSKLGRLVVKHFVSYDVYHQDIITYVDIVMRRSMDMEIDHYNRQKY